MQFASSSIHDNKSYVFWYGVLHLAAFHCHTLDAILKPLSCPISDCSIAILEKDAIFLIWNGLSHVWCCILVFRQRF
jgi:hypothetical protein